MKIIGCNYNTKKCPNCGNDVDKYPYKHDKNMCFMGENTDEGGGTTGYHIICHNNTLIEESSNEKD